MLQIASSRLVDVGDDIENNEGDFYQITLKDVAEHGLN